ncbi:uncharacterized protein [Nicotiana tomentosiformis]|uniref:uncharacterized protein n=1 Tax=Nicotiana tomentosiformis TaxID=4098 RepID=UPI00388C5450
MAEGETSEAPKEEVSPKSPSSEEGSPKSSSEEATPKSSSEEAAPDAVVSFEHLGPYEKAARRASGQLTPSMHLEEVEACFKTMSKVIIRNPSHPSPFFTEQLTAFEVWLDHGSKEKKATEAVANNATGAIQEAQDLGALELDRPHDVEDPFRDLFIGVEDTAGTSDASDLFHGAVTVYRELCSRSRTEVRQYEAELQRVTEERNSLKLILGQMGEEIKDLQGELDRAHQDHIDLSEQVIVLLKAYGLDTITMANLSVSQLQQKIEMIEKLCEEVDVIRAESLKWKEGMDRFAAEKETARAQLSSSKNQLQKMKEKISVKARRIEELEARLSSVQEREAAETAYTRAHWVAELAKCRSRRETLEEIHARGFDLAEEIKRARELEANAEAFVSNDNDDEDGSKSGSENGVEPDGEETAPGNDQEA